MLRRLSLSALGLASPLLVMALLFEPPGAGVLQALLVAVFPAALIGLAAPAGDRSRTLAWLVTTLYALLAGGLLAILALRGRALELPWVGGLPLGAAIELYGLLLAAFVVTSLAYGLGFERHGLRREELDELRRRFGAKRRGAGDGG